MEARPFQSRQLSASCCLKSRRVRPVLKNLGRQINFRLMLSEIAPCAPARCFWLASRLEPLLVASRGSRRHAKKPILIFSLRELFAYRQLLQASVRAAERRHFDARAASPRSGAVVRDFKDHVNPMAEG